jgi:hypothetical protein
MLVKHAGSPLTYFNLVGIVVFSEMVCARSFCVAASPNAPSGEKMVRPISTNVAAIKITVAKAFCM